MVITYTNKDEMTITILRPEGKSSHETKQITQGKRTNFSRKFYLNPTSARYTRKSGSLLVRSQEPSFFRSDSSIELKCYSETTTTTITLFSYQAIRARPYVVGLDAAAAAARALGVQTVADTIRRCRYTFGEVGRR